MSCLTDIPYKLYVRCYTYNHASYIVDAMNGFTMQQTDFPFVCIIVDDASTDGEPDVIKKYLSDCFDLNSDCARRNEETSDYYLYFARHKQNSNCFFAVYFLKYNHYKKKPKYTYFKGWTSSVKYVALCEGDDYWTDSLKLQKQVDFLDTHPDYGLCCHRFKVFHEKTDSWSEDYAAEVFARNPGNPGVDVTNSDNFRTRLTWTLTLCYRKSLYDSIAFPPYKYGLRDFNLHYHLLKAGKGYCFSDFMGVYRVNGRGEWTSLSHFEGAKFRLDCYNDLYQYHKDDPVVLECYTEWLDRFYTDYALSPFRRHKVTKNGVRSLFFTFDHYWKIQGARKAISQFCNCVISFLTIRKSL